MVGEGLVTVHRRGGCGSSAHTHGAVSGGGDVGISVIEHRGEQCLNLDRHVHVVGAEAGTAAAAADLAVVVFIVAVVGAVDVVVGEHAGRSATAEAGSGK